MRLFISAGEPSGDLHGANLIQELRQRSAGDIEFVGFGGQRMTNAGCNLLYPLCDLALMGIWRVVRSLPEIRRVYYLAYDYFREHKPDALVMIDYPGFHWWLARAAKKNGIPVIYFVPPQLWAWASHRVRKMRRLVDLTLCTLPFEKDWFEERGVAAEFVGHPYFDELRTRSVDETFLESYQKEAWKIVSLLPGSRNQEVSYNAPSLVRAASLIHERAPDTRFLFACFNEKHRERVEALCENADFPVDIHVNRTPEIIRLAHTSIACSGSVGLELLFHLKPTVVMFRENWLGVSLARLLMNCKYISLVNLLADRELFPEFLSSRCKAKPISEQVLSWFGNPEQHQEIVRELESLRERVSVPGACGRAADMVLDHLDKRSLRAA